MEFIWAKQCLQGWQGRLVASSEWALGWDQLQLLKFNSLQAAVTAYVQAA